jgi:hypothetical protein
MWDNGLITADSKISHDEYCTWINAIDFFIHKIEPTVTSKSSISKSSEISVPSQKNVAADSLDSVIRHDENPDLQNLASPKPKTKDLLYNKEKETSQNTAERNRRLYGEKTEKKVTNIQDGAYSHKNSKLSGFKVFCLRFFSLTGYFVLIGALLGYGNSRLDGLVVGLAGGGCKGMFWGFVFGLVSYFKFKKYPNEYRFKKHVYVSAIFGAISVSVILLAVLLN